jgi:uncharacterized Zn finger protein
MPACVACGGPIVRRPRNVFNKFVDRAIYKCENCGRQTHRRRPIFTLFRRYCECPKCGTRNLSRLAVRDRIDTMTQNPLRRLLFLFGYPIYHCTFCRYQFRDWRKRQPA